MTSQVETKYSSPVTRQAHLLGLTHTCKQIYAETKGVFYGAKTFILEARIIRPLGRPSSSTFVKDDFGESVMYRHFELDAEKDWLKSIGKAGCLALQHVIIVLCEKDTSPRTFLDMHQLRQGVIGEITNTIVHSTETTKPWTLALALVLLVPRWVNVAE
jgi:hypothetical protein